MTLPTAGAAGTPGSVAGAKLGKAVTVALLGVVATYVLLVVLPFFGHGLHEVPAHDVKNFDPKDLFPGRFISNFIQVIDVGIGPYLVAALVVLGLSSLFWWRQLTTGWRIALVGSMILGATFVQFQFTQIGQTMAAWIYN